MGREPGDRAHGAADLVFLAVQSGGLDPRLKVRPERHLALIAHEQDHRLWIADEGAQVVQDAAAGEHAVRRHENIRPLRLVDLLGVGCQRRFLLVREVDRGFTAIEQGQRFGVVVVAMLAVDRRRLGGHRRVQVQLDLRDPAGVQQVLERPHDLLCSTDRERRDQKHAALGDDIFDGLLELGQRFFFRLVLAAAVGRLDEDVVGGLDDCGVAQDRGGGSAQVAGEDQSPGRDASLSLDAQLHDR